MKNKYLFLPLTALTLLAIHTQPAHAAKATMAVLDFETNDVSTATAATCAEAVRRTVVGTDKYHVVVRDEMVRIFEEQGLQITGCTDTRCAVRLGKVVAARLVLFGTVSKIGALYKVDLRIVDVEVGTAIAAKDAEERVEGDLKGAAAEAALALVGEIPALGRIVEKDGPYYYIDLGSADGVTGDTIFRVVRKGDVVYDDRGEPILTKQLEVGYLQLEDLDEGGSEAVVAKTRQLKQTREPAVGDLVAITAYNRRELEERDYESGLRYRLKYFGGLSYQPLNSGVIGSSEGATGTPVSPAVALSGGVTYRLGRTRSAGVSLEAAYVRGSHMGDDDLLVTDVGTFTDRSYRLISVYVLADISTARYGLPGLRLGGGVGLDHLTAHLRPYPDGEPLTLSASGLGIEIKLGYAFPLGPTSAVPGLTVRQSLVTAESGDAEATVSGLGFGLAVEF